MFEHSESDGCEVTLFLESDAVGISYETHRDLRRRLGSKWDPRRQKAFMEELPLIRSLLHEDGESLNWVSEFQENFWRMELTRCAETRLKMRAVRIQEKSRLCSLLDRGAVPPGFLSNPQWAERILFTLDRRGNYKISGISERLARISGVSEGEPLEQFFHTSLFYQSGLLFDLALLTDRTLQSANIALWSGKVHHMLMTVVPLGHRNRQILLSLRAVSAEAYYRMQLSGAGAHPAEELSGPAVALYHPADSSCQIPLVCNAAFQRIIDSGNASELLGNLAAHLHALPAREAKIHQTLNGKCYFCSASKAAGQGGSELFMTLWERPIDRLEEIGGKLTPRELEIARQLCHGHPLHCIAGYCGISEGTVKKTASNIYRKLGVGGRVELVHRLLPHDA